ncbi:MAG: site-2 protease family protein [Myxococcaceae bacterium]|nr:site-2 protease family protein [Myxococcaceae bacterium]MCI0673025.1 site-2 protease family protein [Myxococcaceae bacterium]
MNGSLQIARVRGIPLKVHVSFLLVLPLLAPLFAARLRMAAEASGVPPGRLGGSPLLWGLGIALALFVSVLLHELAHALYAVARGGRVSSITLLMIGGVTRMEEAPERPRHEATMALVGPLTSLALGGVFLLVGALLRGSGWFNLTFAAVTLGALNLGLGIFNLLPAFPMDGGRILRALLTPSQGVVRATATAASVGKAFAAFFGVVGLLGGNIFLMLIALFVFLGADAEARQVRMKVLLSAMRVQELMSPSPRTLEASASLEEALGALREARRIALPVVDAGQQVVGVLTLQQVQGVAPAERLRVLVSEAMTRDVPLVTPEDEAWKAVQKMALARLPLLPVVAEGQLVGTLDERDVAQGLALAETRVGGGPGRRAPRREAHA